MSKDQKKALKIFLAKVAMAALELRLEMLNQDLVSTATLYRKAVEDLSDELLRSQVDEDSVQGYIQDVLKKSA